MNKTQKLIDFLKSMPSTERRDIESCPHMSLEYGFEPDDWSILVDEPDTTNYWQIILEVSYFESDGSKDDFDKGEIDGWEIVDVGDVSYFDEDNFEIKVEDATPEQLKEILYQLPELNK